MQVTAAIAAAAASAAFANLFKILPVDPAQFPARSLPPDPGPTYQVPRNYGGGTLIDCLA